MIRNLQLSTLNVTQLFELHSGIMDELRAREITRSSNNPTGDLAEYLFCKAFGWTRKDNSCAHVDAVDGDIRYQIKGRRLTRHSKSRELGAIRDLSGCHFDFLAAVLFAENYKVFRAALVPHSVALDQASFVQHTNSYKFLLRDSVWEAKGVRDVTPVLRSIEI